MPATGTSPSSSTGKNSSPLRLLGRRSPPSPSSSPTPAPPPALHRLSERISDRWFRLKIIPHQPPQSPTPPDSDRGDRTARPLPANSAKELPRKNKP
ncbi:Os01g0655225 [Oryza sativa Japonica Group]|uniref:Os01g0655225 protein n=1 Tax=Oryza sativa subsp. japonica TaxID=39947 RepID=A0A0P0V631_ORYSJ|nr:Os01g0655225 [Oryza sativa Japonica Group]